MLSRDQLEALLVVAPGERLSRLEQLRTAPTRVSDPALVAALQRLDQIRAVGVGTIALNDLPQARLARLARHFTSTWVQNLARLGPERRLATLLAGVQALERSATDDVLDLFEGLLTTLALRGKVKRRRERLRSLKDLDQAALVLQQAVRIVLDPAVPDAAVRGQVWQRIGESSLREAAATVESLASAADEATSQALMSSYATVRRFLPALLRGLRFEGTPAAWPLLAAWDFLRQQELAGRGRPRWATAPRMVIPKAWTKRVFPAKDEVHPAAYTLCVLDRLHQALRRREVFVPVSERYGDPRAELLQGEAAREAVARALKRSTDLQVELTQLQAQVRAAYIRSQGPTWPTTRPWPCGRKMGSPTWSSPRWSPNPSPTSSNACAHS